MEEYVDYLIHGRTKGSKNGISHTPGYTAVGKLAMTDAEKKAKATKDIKTASEGLSSAIDFLWRPRNKSKSVYNMPTGKIEAINRRNRAIEEYNRANPSKAQRAKSTTMNIIKGIGSLAVTAVAVMAIVDRFKGPGKNKVSDILYSSGTDSLYNIIKK